MDSYRLWLGSTMVELGSYTLADPGPNFDTQAILAGQFAESPLAEGGALLFEQSKLRRFSFPLRIASSGSNLEGVEQQIRAVARPGAVIDVQPEGVASANFVRFDVVEGRIDPRYSLPMQRAARRDVTLELDVQPFGYLPTMILLASAASIGMPGALAVPGGSIIGDVYPQLLVTVQPTIATQYTPASHAVDGLIWSLGARASFANLISPASLIAAPSRYQLPTALGGASMIRSVIAASVLGDPFAPASQALQLQISATQDGSLSSWPAQTPAAWWAPAAWYTIPQALEPAYRGRYHLFAFARYLLASQPASIMQGLAIIADVVPDTVATSAPLATFRPIATVLLEQKTSVFPGLSASPAYQIVDLGPVTIPQSGSGMAQQPAIRLWFGPVSTANLLGNGAPATYGELRIGGLALMPLDGAGAGGFMPRGLQVPNVAAGTGGALVLDGIADRAYVGLPTGGLASPAITGDARVNYRGPMPIAGPSTLELDLLALGRASTASAPGRIAHAGQTAAAVSVSYRPRFTFARNI